MDKNILKNIEFNKELVLSELVEYLPGQVVSRTLVQNNAVSITLFAFDEKEEISAHTSDGDAMLTVLEGRARITIGSQIIVMADGKTVVMPAAIPHAVAADGRFKMLLTVVFSR